MTKKGGISDVAKGRSDQYRLSPHDLHIKEGWNAREENDPENIEHIDRMAQSIAVVGVKQTVTVYWENGKAFVSDGHCRRAAALKAIEEYGASPDLTVPVVTEERKSTEADRTFSQIVRNSGKPLSPLEQAAVFKRLVELGWTDTEIGKKAGLSRVHVTNLLALLDAPKAVSNLVRTGEVSSTLAINTLKENKGDGKKTVAELKAAVKTAKAAGKTRATAKHLKSAKTGDADKEPKLSFKQIVTDIFARTATSDNPDDGTIIAYFTESDFELIWKLTDLADKAKQEQSDRDSDLV